MAYALKYWYEKHHENGKTIRLEIYKKDSTAMPMEIGDVVQALSLNIDGGEDNLDKPIVSTSLVMTFVDAYDHPEADTKKCGNWAEFYTPDATLWKVVLLSKEDGASYKTMWGGFVTPDSYQEDLVYGGGVTIVARDNIGHLNDFPFEEKGNAEGCLTLQELLEIAWAKIESPMTLTWSTDWMQCDGVDAPQTYINASAFADSNLYEAVESSLFGYGAVLRYKGDNEFVVCPLRSIPLEMAGASKTKKPIFCTGATRMLVPAVKRIEESVSYDLLENALQPLLTPEDFSGEVSTYPCKVDALSGSMWETELHNAPVFGIKPKEYGWKCLDDTPFFFNPDAYRILAGHSEEDIRSGMYVVANNTDSRYAVYTRMMNNQDFRISMTLGIPVGLVTGTASGDWLAQSYPLNLKSIRYGISRQRNGIVEYYNGVGGWGTSAVELVQEYDATHKSYDFSVSVATDNQSGEALFSFYIYKIEYVRVQGYLVGETGLYANIKSFVISVPEGNAYLKNNHINTIYSDKNNVIISRSPKIAPAYDSTILPSMIRNGIWIKNGFQYKPAREWGWKGQNTSQLAVFNHLQILSYYAKPNNLLEGTLVENDFDQFGSVWVWEGKKHLLVSGSYDLLTGYINGAILREYLNYEEMWGDVPATEMPVVSTARQSNKEAQAAGEAVSAENAVTHTTYVTIGNTGGGSTGASYLGDLLDVDTAYSSIGSVLWFDGSQWVDRTLATWLEDLLEKSTYLASLWKIDPITGEMYTEKKVRVKNDVYADGEVSAGGVSEEGEDDSDLTEVFRRLGIVEDEIAEIQSVLDNIGNIGSQMARGLATIATYTGQLITYDHHEGLLFENSIPNTDLPWASGYNNAIISLSRFHDVDGYDTQLGFGANGMYYRAFVGQAPTKEAEWKTFAFTDSIVFGAERLTETISNESINLWQNDGVQMISVTDEGYEALGAPKRWVSGLSVLTSYVGWQLVCGASKWNSTDFFIRKRSDENTFTEWKTLAFIDSNVASADTATNTFGFVKIGANESGRYDPNTMQGGIMVNNHSYAYWDNAPSGMNVGSVVHLAPNKETPHSLQIAVDKYNDKIWMRRGASGTYGDWKQLAFIDSNIASAQALKHSNGTLGAEVDGSGNILAKKDIIIPNYTAYKTYDTNGGGVNLIYLDTNNRMQFFNGNMTLDASGKLGIGRVPSYKLDVNGQIRSVIEDKFGITIEKASGGFDGGGISFWYGDWHRGSIDASILTLNPYTKGNVGVGISNPEALLDVNGDARVRGCLSFSGITTLNTPVIKFASGEYFDIYGNLVFAKNSGSWSIFDQSTDNTLFRIYRASGNVGIGNADPAYKLDVNGSIHSQTGYYVGSSLFAWYDNGTWVRDANTLNLNAGSALKMHINYAEKLSISDTLVDIKTDAKVGGSLNLNGSIIRKEYFALDTDENGNLKFKRTPAQVPLDWSVQLPSGEKLFKLSNDGVCELKSIKIGDATITWDSANNALKIDGNVYATGDMAAGGTVN